MMEPGPVLILDLTYNKYFTPNYSFSTGISLSRAGGRLVSSDTTVMEFTNFRSTVLPGNPVVYKIQYLAIPVGLKLQTNQIGYLTFFSDLGTRSKDCNQQKSRYSFSEYFRGKCYQMN